MKDFYYYHAVVAGQIKRVLTPEEVNRIEWEFIGKKLNYIKPTIVTKEALRALGHG